MKMLLKIVVALVLVVIIAAAVIYWRIDQIVAAAIERGGTYATGVETRVEGVDLAIFSGRLEVMGLNMANPEGYPETGMLDSKRLAVAVKTGSLRSKRVVIPELRIEGMTVNLDREDGKYNLQVIADNLEKLGSGERDPDAPKPESKQKYVVEKIIIRDVTGNVELLAGGSVPVNVDEIIIENVTDENAEGVLLHELFAQLLPAVMAGVLDNVGELPGALKDMLFEDLAGAAGQFGEGAVKLIEQAVPEMGEMVGDAMEGAGEKAGEAVEGIGEGIGDMLPGGDGGDGEQ